jgi:hypothetical protein
MKSEKMYKGRKFIVLLICVPLWVALGSSLVWLYHTHGSIPMALGIAFGTLTNVFPIYLGVNVVQKKIQAGAPAQGDSCV